MTVSREEMLASAIEELIVCAEQVTDADGDIRIYASCAIAQGREALAALRAAAELDHRTSGEPVAWLVINLNTGAKFTRFERATATEDAQQKNWNAAIEPLYTASSLPGHQSAASIATKREDMVMRQPVSGIEQYSNDDIAQRMWQTYNVCGDRWFQYAAQRLEASAASEINHYEDAPAGRIDWKMEAERANRLLAAVSHSQEGCLLHIWEQLARLRTLTPNASVACHSAIDLIADDLKSLRLASEAGSEASSKKP